MNNGVLYFRGILGFVHADIGKGLLKIGQNVRILLQDRLGIDHLIVIVHPPLLAQQQIILLVKLREPVEARVQFGDLLLLQNLVFYKGNPFSQFSGHVLAGKFPVQFPVQVRHQLGKPPFVLHQREGRSAAVGPGVIGDDFGRNAVDRPKFRDFRAILSEKRRKALLHLPGGRFRVGHGQNFIRRDAAAAEHIPQPGHQHGGLSAAGDRQQQDCPLHGVDRFLLLGVQPPGIFPVKFRSVHADAPSV